MEDGVVGASCQFVIRNLYGYPEDGQEARLYKIEYQPEEWIFTPDTHLLWQRAHAEYSRGVFEPIPRTDHHRFILQLARNVLNNSTTTILLIQVLRKLFSRKGIPRLLVTDDGLRVIGWTALIAAIII